jgi:2',3'-cyclic-nucleotide 2'-phosphodiesterase / 3'-nucleotidase
MNKNRLPRSAMASALVLALVLAAALAGAQAKPSSLAITLLETSDIHGMVMPYNFMKAAASPTSLAQVATIVAAEREKPGNEVVLLDDGDSLQGQPFVYYYNFEKTGVPHIWGQAINTLGYAAIGVGNHDIEAGHAVYDKLYGEVVPPVICANALKADGTPYFKPYTVIERQGVKIAVLGMITPWIPNWLPEQLWKGMTFADMVQTAKKWVPIIQQTEKPDILVGLFHSGVDYTYGGATKDTPGNENAAQLVAEQVAGFDAILVGHDHQGWDGQGWDPAAKAKKDVIGPDGKKVYIVGPRNDASGVGYVRIDLTLDKASGTYKKAFTTMLIPTAGIAPYKPFVAKFQPAADEVKAWVNKPIGKLAEKITTRDSMFGDSAFVDLIHRIQLELTADPAMGLKKADVSFAAPLTMDATIPTSADGTMYVRDMFSLYQYENFLYTMDMTGKQIRDFLEYSYKLWLGTMPNEGNHLIAMSQDKAGNWVYASKYYNYDSAAGIDYTVDVSKPVGSRVAISRLSDGRPFSLDATYTVAINSYRGQGGGGHLTTGAGMDKDAVQKLKLVNGATTKDLRFYLLKWFEKQSGAVTVAPIGNWKIVPEDQAAKGKATDMPILFPPK